MKKQILVIVLSIVSLSSFGQRVLLKSEEEVRALSIKVTNLFQEGKITESFNEIRSYWPLSNDEIKDIEQKTNAYWVLLKDRFGKPIGSLKSKEEKIENIALRETYLIRYSNTAIRMIFTYYKNDSGWIINAFRWDDAFVEEFH